MKQIFTLLLLLQIEYSYSQSITTLKVVDIKTKVAQAFVSVSEKNVLLGTTDSIGKCSIELSNGTHQLTFTLIGFVTLNKFVEIPQAGQVLIELTSSEINLDEVVIVASSRNNSNIENSTLKVEVLGKEELGEEASIKPGNIASILVF